MEYRSGSLSISIFIDLDLMREIAHAEGTSRGYPSWVGGKVSVEPSSESWGARWLDITPGMRAWPRSDG